MEGKVFYKEQTAKAPANFGWEKIHRDFIDTYKSLSKALDALCNKFPDRFTVQYEKSGENPIHPHVLINSLLPVIGYNKIREIYRRLPEKLPGSIGAFKAFLSRVTGPEQEFPDACFHPLYISFFSATTKESIP